MDTCSVLSGRKTGSKRSSIIECIFRAIDGNIKLFHTLSVPPNPEKIPGFYEQEIEPVSLLPGKGSSLAKEKLVNYVDFIIYLI